MQPALFIGLWAYLFTGILSEAGAIKTLEKLTFNIEHHNTL